MYILIQEDIKAICGILKLIMTSRGAGCDYNCIEGVIEVKES
jgi:hypothetical protein